MRGIKILGLVALAVTGLVLGTGAASGQKNPAAKRTNVIHVRDLVVNGRSVDSSRVPARVQRLLKRADSPYFSCPGANQDTKVNSATAQTCVWGPDYHGQVTCIQTSNSPTVIQTCKATQTNTTQTNKALIIQIVWSQSRSVGQDGTQVVRLSQMNGSGTNLAGISQYIKQSRGPGTPDDTEDGDAEPLAAPTTPPDQIQNSHQTVHLHQVTTTGDSAAAVLQFLRQRERASNVLTSNQNQNRGPQHDESVCTPDGSDELAGVTTDSNANQCVLSNQTSDLLAGGHLNLGVNQDYNQFQRVRKAAGGFQNQGFDSDGGSDIGLTQASSGQSNILTNQNERLVQRALDAAAVAQNQNGPRKGFGSSQGPTNTADVWKGFQTSALIQTSHSTGSSFKKALVTAGHQSDLLEYFGHTSGDIRATQTAIINGAPTNWGCPLPGLPSTGQNHDCAAVVHCTVGETGGDFHVQAVAGVCTPTCPAGTEFNPGTGTCDVVETSSTCEYPCIGAPTTPLYARRH